MEAGIGERENDGKAGLDAEVDGEHGGLKGGELRAWERFVGYGAADEGLEEGRAEEGAVSGDVRSDQQWKE